MNQPPISNDFVEPGCEQFTQPPAPSPEQENRRDELIHQIASKYSEMPDPDNCGPWYLSALIELEEQLRGDFAKERADLEQKISALKLTNSIVAISNPDLEEQLSSARTALAAMEEKVREAEKQRDEAREYNSPLMASLERADEENETLRAQLASTQAKLNDAVRMREEAVHACKA